MRSGESVKGIIRNLTGFTNLCTKSDKDVSVQLLVLPVLTLLLLTFCTNFLLGVVSFKRINLQPGPLFKDCQHSIPQETLSVAMEWLHPYATMKMMCTKIDAVINYIKTNTETLVSCLHTLYDFSVNCHTFNLSPYLSEAYLLCYNINVLHVALWQ